MTDSTEHATETSQMAASAWWLVSHSFNNPCSIGYILLLNPIHWEDSLGCPIGTYFSVAISCCGCCPHGHGVFCLGGIYVQCKQLENIYEKVKKNLKFTIITAPGNSCYFGLYFMSSFENHFSMLI